MSILSPDDSGADPIATARRIYLIRRLLVDSVRRYRETLDFCGEVDRATPIAFRPPHDPEAEMGEEGHAWRRLICDAEAEHYSAEVSLAQSINNLYNFLAPEDRRIGPTAIGGNFEERGISIDGTAYVLMSDPADFEPGVNIVAMVRPDRVIDLAG
jgi:hypothetical protein